MNAAEWTELIVLILLIILSAFFSSAETAFTTANTIRIRSLADSGDRRASCLLQILGKQDKMLSAVLIGNNIVNLSASALSTALTLRLFGSTAVSISTGILTLVILIFGEVAPKTSAMLNADRIALRDVYVIRALMFLLTPVIFFVNHAARFVVRLGGIDPDKKQEAMTESELRTIVDVSRQDGVIENEEQTLINNVFDFGDTEAVDIMIPWIDVTSADLHSSYSDLIRIFKEHRFTRLPVVTGTPDEVVGILNMKDLLLVDPDSFTVSAVMRRPYFTFEHKKVTGLLKEMQKNSLSIVIVIDEYGATSGIITMENVIEEIVGDINDEYVGRDAEEITEISKGREYSCLGSVSLDDLNEATGLHLESDAYETIGGYIIEHSEDTLPQVGEYITTDEKASLVVESVNKNRIMRVHIYLPENGSAKKLEQEENPETGRDKEKK